MAFLLGLLGLLGLMDDKDKEEAPTADDIYEYPDLTDRSIGKRPETTRLNARGFFLPYDAEGKSKEEQIKLLKAEITLTLALLLVLTILLLWLVIPWRRVGRFHMKLSRRIVNKCRGRSGAKASGDLEALPQQDIELQNGLQSPAPITPVREMVREAPAAQPETGRSVSFQKTPVSGRRNPFDDSRFETPAGQLNPWDYRPTRSRALV
ncbi:Fc.00g083640.m01.CDS01 [Cosmosporella sp. VM-42]